MVNRERLEHLVIKGSTDDKGIIIAPIAFHQLFLHTAHALANGDTVRKDNSQTKINSVYATIYGTVSYSFEKQDLTTRSEVNLWSNTYAIVCFESMFRIMAERARETKQAYLLINDLKSD